MRLQSLLICERVLGIEHNDALFRFMYRGASYADALRFQRCIDLWRFVLEVRVNAHTIFHSDTCFTAQAIVRLMLDLKSKYLHSHDSNYAEEGVPRFDDVYSVFDLLKNSLTGNRFL